MMFKSEESLTRNGSTSKESRLGKSDSVRREGKRKTTEDVLEGFAPGGSRKGGRGRNTIADVLESIAPGICKSKIWSAKVVDFIANPPTRKLSVCLAEVVRFQRPTRLSRIGSTSTPRKSYL